jgi:hypothetical protein
MGQQQPQIGPLLQQSTLMTLRPPCTCLVWHSTFMLYTISAGAVIATITAVTAVSNNT